MVVIRVEIYPTFAFIENVERLEAYKKLVLSIMVLKADDILKGTFVSNEPSPINLLKTAPAESVEI